MIIFTRFAESDPRLARLQNRERERAVPGVTVRTIKELAFEEYHPDPGRYRTRFCAGPALGP
jgi:hypothetical protein